VASILSVDEVREYVSDFPSENLLLDRQEFSDTFITLCIDMAAEEYNQLSPMSAYNSTTFPSKSLLLTGTLWKMYAGKAALLARNHMSYSDGGLQIPVEERMQLYQSLAQDFGNQFSSGASRLKVSENVAGGWGEVYSDNSVLPWF
jgi:hypothetical protein